ncbi:MAG TPA: nicotinate (nicotinamide) nucleotide adenylyltransferase [Deltaproteobacteria bacterium]|nr:nicotinate (nicotinamide) nucleotide adenylyltransferase [Deltaproteobacteria bacterium]
MRIGLFGGTFNPIHYGHLRASLEVKEEFGLDKIYLIPSAIPPHKSPRGVVDAKDRFHMIQLAISDQSDFIVSDVELDRPGPSYSIDTVHHFQKILPKDPRFYLILGTDAFYEIDTWKAYKDFFDLVPMIIMLRPGDRFSMAPKRHSYFETFLKTKISEKYSYSEDLSCFIHPEKQSIFIAYITSLDISSTHIRDLIGRGKSIRYLVPDSVADYIVTKGLYL